ncbi:zf-HC2 domain-containing protein [Chitinophaga sp. Hz27]|uniref:zf-HC2 domain-containing protein n=1 Tax=Chitinophaga sp. Hz27 TaxID=3347169 RepID=UPI0035E0F161
MLSNNSSQHDKVIKIFSGIRCLSKDQLPRYLDGRLTDVEKHLVEQHLVDCDLCFEALQALEKEGNTDRYNDLTGKLQRYIQQSISPVSHTQKVAQYTRKEKYKENFLVFFWILAFGAMGISGVYVLRGHMRNQPEVPRIMASAVTPSREASEKVEGNTDQSIVKPDHESPPPTVPVAAHPAPTTPVVAPGTPATTAVTPPVPLSSADSAKLKALNAAKAAKLKARTDSIRKANLAAAEARKTDSIRRENEQQAKDQQAKADAAAKAAAAAKEKDQAPPEPAKRDDAPKKDAAAIPITNSDENLYKSALQLQQQGNVNEAMDRYRRIESNGNPRYVELARYQLALCYRSKGQSGKARRMFKEVVRMDGSMKNAAQQALDAM